MSPRYSEEYLKQLNDMGLDPWFLIRESFLGYKYRKENKMLYSNDREIPTKLIKLYYGFKTDKAHFDTLRKAFVTHYAHEESKLEGLDIKNKHNQMEIEGCKAMYRYIHFDPEIATEEEKEEFKTRDSIDYVISHYRADVLRDLHELLYSRCPFPEFGGQFRNHPVYLPGTGIEICQYDDIAKRLHSLDRVVDELVKRAKTIREECDVDGLMGYIKDVIKLKCELVLIHPFPDGNGRVIRGFTNKMLEYAGLPPIYVKNNERTEYHKALNKANDIYNKDEQKYDDIIDFYMFKICDSIVELEINERMREERFNSSPKLVRVQKNDKK